MRTLVHLSDLHFGRINTAVLTPLLTTVSQLAPDLVAISGDLTQRAHSEEFKQARAFLDALPTPQIVVPGNHDVPLYNLFGRFVQRLGKYRRYITRELRPSYTDEEMVVVGLNTARSMTVSGGRVNTEQIAWVQERFKAEDAGRIKILVTHHPLDLPTGYDSRYLVGRARMALEVLTACNTDLLLSGHLHLSHTAQMAIPYRVGGWAALVVQAGTATSTRHRGETNAFNVIRIARPYVSVEHRTWQPEQAAFVPAVVAHFVLTPDGWRPATTTPIDS